MKEEYSALFTPWKVRDLEIKNRIVLAPMGGTCIFGWMKPCHFDKEAAKLLLKLAQNNVGLIIPGIAPIRDVMGRKWLYKNKKMFVELKEFMAELHKTGAKMFVQLTAGFGRAMALSKPLAFLASHKAINSIAKIYIDCEYLTAAPSVLPNRWADNVTTREITKKEIADIVYAFGEIARLLKEADVDGVEVHAVHEGYLLDQFTLPYCNKRTDEYGGSFENRYRFPVEIVKAIKEKCGEDFPVSLRYSVLSKTKDFRYGAMPGEEYVEVGRDMEESEKAAKYLQDAGYDMLNCDNGTYDAWYWAHPPAYMPLNCNLEDVKHIKKFVDIPVVCAGRMTPTVGSEAVKNNEIDAMAVGRQFLTDQEWVTKLINEQEDEIMPCICCHNACFDLTKWEGSANEQDLSDSLHMCRCALNPTTMNSKKYKIEKTNKPKNVAIVGGGIGGMEAARVLTLRGHKVTIYEKSNELGGIFVAAAASPYKENDKRLIEWYKKQIEKLGIKVNYNMDITNVKELDADEIIIATGSKANRLRMPGSDRTIDAVDYLLGNNTVGEDVVIIGGGLSGCEIGYDLYLEGKRPVIIEMKEDLMAVKNLCLANSSFLRDFFKTNKVPVYLKTALKEIGDDYVIVKNIETNEETKIKADSIITSIGYRPAPVVTEKELEKNMHVIGDCKKVGNLRTVIWSAWDVAMKI